MSLKSGILTATAWLTLTSLTTASPGTSTESIPSVLQQVRIGNTSVAPDSAMSPPVALVHPSPLYTSEALHANVEGTVTVRAEFDIEGNFQVLEVMNSPGYGLERMALAALERWQFAPAYRAGRRVRVVANIDIEFRLTSEGAAMSRRFERAIEDVERFKKSRFYRPAGSP